MPILTLHDIRLALGLAPLFDGIDLSVERGERVCIVGRNGAGKSTLLRIIAGETVPDDGEIIRSDGLRIAMLAQDVPIDVAGTVFQVVAAGLGAAGALVERYHRLAHALADGETDCFDALERCQQELEAAGGWEVNQRVETTLSRLGLDADARIDELSGGLRRRVLLGRALVNDPDILLLDEPTNHLDIDAITWLEDFLLGWNGTLLFITHDRAFLQRLATRIVEIDRGRIADFPGDYATYIERKAAMLADEATRNALFDKRLAQEEVWIRRGIEARRTRNEGRVRALKSMREDRAARRDLTGRARIQVQTADRSGKIVAEAEGVSFSWNGEPVIRDLTATILRGDKVGIVGPNGAGKTTLIRLLLGELQPTSGTLKTGTNLEVAYFDQYRAALDPEKTVQENVGQGRDMLDINGQPRHVLSWLQDFLFTPERARQPVKALSGGERNRLLLARLFTRPANVLVLDEPTNDLDADTLDLLEELLTNFTGTVLLVSHDRAFLDNVVTSTLAFEGDGRFEEYVGGYRDWLKYREANMEPLAPTGKGAGMRGGGAPSTPIPALGAKPKKLSYKDQRELEALPGRIEALEAELEQLHATMADPDFYKRDKDAIAELQNRIAAINAELATAYARWEALDALGG